MVYYPAAAVLHSIGVIARRGTTLSAAPSMSELVQAVIAIRGPAIEEAERQQRRWEDEHRPVATPEQALRWRRIQRWLRKLPADHPARVFNRRNSQLVRGEDQALRHLEELERMAGA